MNARGQQGEVWARLKLTPSTCRLGFLLLHHWHLTADCPQLGVQWNTGEVEKPLREYNQHNVQQLLGGSTHASRGPCPVMLRSGDADPHLSLIEEQGPIEPISFRGLLTLRKAQTLWRVRLSPASVLQTDPEAGINQICIQRTGWSFFAPPCRIQRHGS